MLAAETSGAEPSLPTASAAVVCPLCGGTRLHYLFSVAGSRVVRCEDCQLMLRDLRVVDASLAGNLVARQPAEGLKIPPDIALAQLESYRGRSGGRMLAITRGDQEWLSAAQRRGLQTVSVDYTDSDDFEGPANGELFDVVALYNVIDAVLDPAALLAHARARLAPDGVLFLASSVFDNLSGREHRHGRLEFNRARHFYFTRATLETLLVRNGFEKIIVRTGKGEPARGAEDDLVFLARPQPRQPPQKLSLVVPVFNEARTFEANFEKLLAKTVAGLDIEIIVVESNSTDGTRPLVARYAEHPRVTIVWEDRPRGKGHAVRAGLERITGDYVLIQDADLEYDLEDYEALLEPLVQGHVAFVLGARHGCSAWKMRSFTGQPVISAVLNGAHWFFTLLVNVGFGARLKDPFTMYKVFRRDCLYGLDFVCNRFDFDFELVIKLLRKGYYPLEIPVNYRSRSFAEGKKVSFFSDPLTWLRALVRFRLEPMDPLENIVRQRQLRAGTEAAAEP